MTLAKITVTGKVTKNPEKRFTQSNVAITDFVMDINPQDETLVRVIALGGFLADKAADVLKVGDTALVDGRMQTATVKTTSGKDRRIIEINASSIEKISIESGENQGWGRTSQGSGSYNAGGNAGSGYQQRQNPAPAQNIQPQAPKSSDIVQFAVDEISEDLIDEDEIPF